jgi:broad specificity phosphatase PhoE
MDSDLSPQGEAMVERLKIVLSQQDFLARQGVQLIVHSPLLRARRTCLGIFGSDGVAGGGSAGSVPVEQHDLLYEQSVKETVGLGDMSVRVRQVTAWLLQRSESCICVVGHSAFFRAMLAPAAVHPNNCDVWHVELKSDGTCANARRVVEGGTALLAPS